MTREINQLHQVYQQLQPQLSARGWLKFGKKRNVCRQTLSMTGSASHSVCTHRRYQVHLDEYAAGDS